MSRLQDSRLAAASAALDSNEPEKGFALFENLARTGSTTAMLVLASIYATGRIAGIGKDYSEALYWLERAYRNGSFSASIDLCKIYSHGDDKYAVPMDEKKAFLYIRMFERIKFPNLDQAYGIFMLANHYENGRGVIKDISKAIELYRRASMAGHIPSKVSLSRLQLRRGNLFAIASWLFAMLSGQFLLFLKGPKKAWEDPRMKL